MPYQLTEAIRADILAHGDLHVARIQQLAAQHGVPFYQMRDWCSSLLSKPSSDAINARSMHRAQHFLARVPPPTHAQLAVIERVERAAVEEAGIPLTFTPRACANPECGKSFTPRTTDDQQYCSIECVHRSSRLRSPRSCANPNCGVVFIPPRNYPKKRFCSTRCAYLMQRGPRRPTPVQWDADEV